MKITLISPYPDVTAFGVRTLAAHVKAHGHQARLVFLPDPFGDHIIQGVARYPESALLQTAELCADSDLVGVSLMTNHFDGAVQITNVLRRSLKVPIVWGGVHPTIRPEECIQHADIVCIGEGEDSLLALMNALQNRTPLGATPGCWVKNSDGTVNTNPLACLPADLDGYPAPDYSMHDHHVMMDGKIVPLNHLLLQQFLAQGSVAKHLGRTGYQTMTSRDCPYSCTYCINDTIRRMYGGQAKLRWRSVDHVISELKAVRRDMPYVDYIWISDDEFMARRKDDLAEFCRRYKAEIGLPFSCLVSPVSVTEEKMAMLVDAGLCYVQMGVESGSPRMQEIYRRKNMGNERLMKAIQVINKFKDKLAPPSYDFLLDVPFETDDDRIQTIQLISRFPKPYRLQPFSLILYPGTHLYTLAKEQGLIKDEHAEIYNKTYVMHEPSYLNFVVALAKDGKMPGALLRAMVWPPLVRVMQGAALKPAVAGLYKTLRALKRKGLPPHTHTQAAA